MSGIKKLNKKFAKVIFAKLSALKGIETQLLIYIYCWDVLHNIWFSSKKKILAKKLGESNLNEFNLYHGTSVTAIDGICAQNFDLNGVNAYGQGSYFAKDASYSLGYTRPDSNNIRYMFLAKVLDGKYIRAVSYTHLTLPTILRV